MNSIQVSNLKKSYGKNEILHGISFDVKQGEIFGLLGVNGAGKTTTLSCIEGVTKVSEGAIKIDGDMGVQLQVSSLPKTMKCIEALQFFATWKKTKVNEECMKRLGIDSFKNNQYHKCSTGQKRRLHLAVALLGNPDIVVLDEPTAGLDVEGRYALHEEIKALKKQGKTILMASHDMSEVEELCDRIAILKNGEIAFVGGPQELSMIIKKKSIIQLRFDKAFKNDSFLNCKLMESNEKHYSFETENITESLIELSTEAKKQGVNILDIKLDNPTLEQQFMAIAKENNL